MSVIVIGTSHFRVVITRDNRVICDTKTENKAYITRDSGVMSDEKAQNKTKITQIF